MPHHPVVCVFSDGQQFSVTAKEAEKLVADDMGVWAGKRTVRMNDHDRTGGRLSSRLGEYLAFAVSRRKPWARAMLEQIER